MITFILYLSRRLQAKAETGKCAQRRWQFHAKAIRPYEINQESLLVTQFHLYKTRRGSLLESYLNKGRWGWIILPWPRSQRRWDAECLGTWGRVGSHPDGRGPRRDKTAPSRWRWKSASPSPIPGRRPFIHSFHWLIDNDWIVDYLGWSGRVASPVGSSRTDGRRRQSLCQHSSVHLLSSIYFTHLHMITLLAYDGVNSRLTQSNHSTHANWERDSIDPWEMESTM